MSAAEIANTFEGATRNAVIGLAHRHPDKVRLSRLQGRKTANKNRQRKARAGEPEKRKRAAERSLTPPDLPPPVPAQQGRLVAWADATDAHCRYPLWSPDAPASERFFCGALPIDGSPYCLFHTHRTRTQP